MATQTIANMCKQKLFLGMPTRTDSEIASMEKEKTQDLKPGDFVKIAESGLMEKATSASDILYGVVTGCVAPTHVSVLTHGHILAKLGSSFNGSATVGTQLNNKCSCLLVHKVKAIDDQGEEVDAFEVKI